MSRKDKILNGNALYTFIAIIIGFVAGAVLLAVAGINPGLAYGKLLNGVFGQVKYITWSIVYAAPLILTGLSVAFSFRTGVFNIGAEGQFVVGSIAACTVGILFDLPAPIHILLCIAAAVAAGAVWGIIVGFLKVKRGINEVLSYIMFNWIAFYLSNYIVNLSAIHRTGGGEASKDVADSARILAPEFITKLTRCTAANWGIVIAVAAACIFAGLFYGAMKYGGGKLSLVKAPAEVVDIIMGIIIFFIAIAHMFKVIFNRKKGGK